MTLILVGLNHQTAPVELREQFYLDNEAVHSALLSLHGDGLTEAAVVSTCNRLEIVAYTESSARGFEIVGKFLARSQTLAVEQMDAYLYFLEGRAAIEHMMRVASGLESLILGETQVLGQVAHALAQAQTANMDGAVLSHLFTAALHAGKRARTETAISQHTLSVSHAAVLLMQQHINALSAARVLVIGAGEMAELAVRALQMQGVSSISLVNRTASKADTLAQQLNIKSLNWNDFPQILDMVDVVIAATSAPHPIIRFEDVVNAGQRTQPMLLVDIGVPRNVDEAVRELTQVHLYDIDDLQMVVDHHFALRQAEITQVETIISEELDRFWWWLQARKIVPLITELRHQAEALAQIEVEQTLRRLPELDADQQEIVMQLAHRIVNKLLHTPTVRLKSRAAQGDHYDYAHAVRQLFALDDVQITVCVNDE